MAVTALTGKQLGGPAVQTLKTSCSGGTDVRPRCKLRGEEGCAKWEETQSQGRWQVLRQHLGKVAACSAAFTEAGRPGACWEAQRVGAHWRLGFVRAAFSDSPVVTFYYRGAMREERPPVG